MEGDNTQIKGITEKQGAVKKAEARDQKRSSRGLEEINRNEEKREGDYQTGKERGWSNFWRFGTRNSRDMCSICTSYVHPICILYILYAIY